MKASAVLASVDDLLNDLAGVRWTPAARLRWLNEGQLAIVSVRPDAKAKTSAITLVAGDMQVLPAEGIRLLDIIRNVNGRGVTLISREIMNDLNSAWYGASGKSVIKHYAFDPRAPREFQVVPPSVAGVALLARYSVVPVDCSTADADIDLDATFAPALVNWICYRAYLRDAEAASQEAAATYLNAFTLLLTGKSASDKSKAPGNSYPGRLAPNPQ